MPVHPVVFFENQDGTGALQNLGALDDSLARNIWPRDGNTDFLRASSPYLNVVGVYAAIDATVQPRARITATTFKDTIHRTGYEIPVLSSTVEPGSPPAFNDLRQKPFRVAPTDLVGIETLNNPAAAADQYVVLLVADQVPQAVPADGGYWARFITAASAMTADTWNNRSLSSDENLDPGSYQVLGAKPISTSAIMARLAFPNQIPRPPVLGMDTRTDVAHPSFEYPGSWGVMGTFDTENLPSADFLVDAADNEVQVLDLFIRQTSRKLAGR